MTVTQIRKENQVEWRRKFAYHLHIMSEVWGNMQMKADEFVLFSEFAQFANQLPPIRSVCK